MNKKLFGKLIIVPLVFLLLLPGCESVLYPNGRPEDQILTKHKPSINYTEIVNSLLARYSKNFNRRDSYGLHRIRDYIFTDDAEVIYGNACGPDSFGWSIGSAEIVTAIERDWRYWEYIGFDENNLSLKHCAEIVWFSTTGNLVVTKDIEDKFKKLNDYYFETEKKHEANENVHNYNIHVDIVHMLFDFLFDDTKEDGTYDIKFVVSGVVVKSDDDWKIAQLHSSYPISFDLGRPDQ